MSFRESEPISEVWKQVKTWTPWRRITLGRRILESREAAEIGTAPPRKPLRDLLGLLQTEAPPPNDEECQRILEDGLMKKHLG
jgi:hypothetical protein